MTFLNSRRNSYEELLPTRDQFLRTDKCRSLLRSLAVVTLCFVGVVLVVQMTNFGHDEEAILVQTSLLGQNQNREVDVLVTVELGQIQGISLLSRDGRAYFAFLGVPYAKPPIKSLRFSPTEKLEGPWENILNATEVKTQCIQLFKNKATGNVTVVGSEDCLYLNIYTPMLNRETRNRRKDSSLPVIVYLHGGINNGNASQYGAEYFMDEDVVLVMVHYRLHVFGNLNTGDSTARGNFAAKDQVMALKWVQKNIGAFGGDNSRVTLYGTSYGSMMTSVHLLSPISKGLFHRTIMQSGTLLSVRNKDTRQKEAEKLAEVVKCPKNSSIDMVECFRRTSSELLTLSARELNFGITIEPKSENPDEDTCVPDEPLRLLEEGKFNSVPSIHGVTSAESLVTALSYLLSYNDTSCDTRIPDSKKNQMVLDLMKFEYAQNPQILAQALREFYFVRWNLTGDMLLQNLTNLISDREWVHPMSIFVKNQLKAQSQLKNPIFLYYFSRESENSYANSLKESWGKSSVPFGVQHADDLQYFFPNNKFPKIVNGSKHYTFSKFMVRMWVNFARTGKPTSAEDQLEWKSFKINDGTHPNDSLFNWMELNDNPRMFEPYGVHDRIELWDSFNLNDLYI